jgi:hypothetical protein
MLLMGLLKTLRFPILTAHHLFELRKGRKNIIWLRFSIHRRNRHHPYLHFSELIAVAVVKVAVAVAAAASCDSSV